MNLLPPVRDPVSGRDEGGLIPVCPRCQVPLDGVKHPLGIAWQCAACGGKSLNFSQFRRLIPELHANEIWMTAMEQPVAPRRRVRCPECRRDMTAVLIPFQGREIELDLCRRCQRLWMEHRKSQLGQLDHGEAGPRRKPPVIRLTGRGVERGSGEKRRRFLDRAHQEQHGNMRVRFWVLMKSWIDWMIGMVWPKR